MQNIFELSRNEIQEILESNLGMAVYDDTSIDELRDCLAENLSDDCMDGVLCDQGEAEECKARYLYQKTNGYEPIKGLQYEGTFPSVKGEPLKFCEHYLTEDECISEKLIRFFDLSRYWNEIMADYETVEIDSDIQVWRK